MNALIIDVDCVQIGIQDNRSSWNEEVRINSVDTFQTKHIEVNKKEARCGYTYVVRLWCRTEEEKSICILICDPWSTMYRQLRVQSDKEIDKNIKNIERIIRSGEGFSHFNGASKSLMQIQVVKRKSTFGYQIDSKTKSQCIFPWLEIRVASAYYRKMIAYTILPAVQNDNKFMIHPFIDGESKVEVYAEVLEKLNLKPGGWLHMNPEVVRRITPPNATLGPFCDLVVQVRMDELKPYDTQSISAVRVLSWDIECFSTKGAFPNAHEKGDKIIAIGLSTSTFYSETPNHVRKVISLGCVEKPSMTDPSQDFEIIECSDEAAMFRRFVHEITQSNADVLVGFYTYGFDWKYIRDRLTLQNTNSDPLQVWSRVANMPCKPQEQQLGSSAMGDNPLCYPRTPGRLGIDLWFYLKRQNSPDLPNLKLNTVSEHYLKDRKDDLPAKTMFQKYSAGNKERYEVMKYCIKDCDLVLRLLDKLCVIPELFEMAKVTGTIPEDLLYRGQQIKVYTQLLTEAHRLKDDIFVVQDYGERDSVEGKYQGAHVEEPHIGYYTDPIICVDFSSLYPSIMRTFNLSPDTLLHPDDAKFVNHMIIEIGEGKQPLHFVKASVSKGILTKILDRLINERSKVKKEMSGEIDPFKRSLLNAKQLALKISANSVYGFKW